MSMWIALAIVLGVTLLCSAVGFKKFVYFLSIGYGFAIAGGGIAIFVMALACGWNNELVWLSAIQMALFVLYGARLSGFLLAREIKSASYKKTMKEAVGEKKIPIFVSITVWIVVALLYTMQVSPMLFRHMFGYEDIILPLVGAGISALGLILETVADFQKSAQKKANPNMVATKGLYRMCRCPNYLGEILFWVGVFVGGISSYDDAFKWIIAVLALVCIIYIMFNGAQRLEKRQMKRYGDDPEYNEYANKTPIIIPLIPLYHLSKKEGGDKDVDPS